MYQDISGSELNKILVDNPNEIILVNYAAEYIGESNMLDNIVQELSRKDYDKIRFYRIDSDVSSDHVAAQGIFEIPTIVIYSSSELVYHATGLQSRYHLRKTLDKLSGIERPENDYWLEFPNIWLSLFKLFGIKLIKFGDVLLLS